MSCVLQDGATVYCLIQTRFRHMMCPTFRRLPRSIMPSRIPSDANNLESDLCCDLSESFQSDSDRRIRSELHTIRSNPCQVLSDSDEIRRNPDRNPTDRIAWPRWMFKILTRLALYLYYTKVTSQKLNKHPLVLLFIFPCLKS
jgi:hypothetical protein